MKLRQSWTLVSVFVILVALGVVSAVVLFQQTQPGVPLAGTMTPNCTNTFATPNNVTLGGTGQVTFSCNSNTPTTSPAFTTGGPVVVTPTVTGLAAPYNTTGLYIYVANGAVNTGICGGRTGGIKVNSGVPTAVPQGPWNYCAKYDTVGLSGLQPFTVTWSL